VNRLLDMGVEDYLLTSTVVGILAQRLVRNLCPHCRKPYQALPEVIEQMGLRRFVPEGEVTLWHPGGCDQCSDTGYRGRMGIMEMLPMSDRIRSLVMRHANSADLRAAAVEDGMESMFENGLRKAVAGTTTVEEVLRVTRED
jgi:general secretion pathway protein E